MDHPFGPGLFLLPVFIDTIVVKNLVHSSQTSSRDLYGVFCRKKSLLRVICQFMWTWISLTSFFHFLNNGCFCSSIRHSLEENLFPIFHCMKLTQTDTSGREKQRFLSSRVALLLFMAFPVDVSHYHYHITHKHTHVEIR